MDLTRIAAYIVLSGFACMVTAAWLTNWLFGLFTLGMFLVGVGASSLRSES